MLGFCGLSFDKVREEKVSLKGLKDLKDFTLYMLMEIRHSHIPIPDICKEYVTRCDGELGNFLEKVCEQFEDNGGKSFEGLWEEELQKSGEGSSLKKEERELLHRFSKNFGYCNTGMQISAIEQYLQEVEKLILQREKKFQDNKKVILYFGVMSGLLLSIILL